VIIGASTELFLVNYGRLGLGEQDFMAENKEKEVFSCERFLNELT